MTKNKTTNGLFKAIKWVTLRIAMGIVFILVFAIGSFLVQLATGQI